MKFDNILGRIREHKPDLIRDEALAKALGLSPGAFANHKQRGSVPYKQLVRFCTENNLNLKFIFTGEKESADNVEGEEMLKDLIKAQQKIIELQEENKQLREELSKAPTRFRKKSGNGA